MGQEKETRYVHNDEIVVKVLELSKFAIVFFEIDSLPLVECPRCTS
jgi:hypothetical protein